MDGRCHLWHCQPRWELLVLSVLPWDTSNMWTVFMARILSLLICIYLYKNNKIRSNITIGKIKLSSLRMCPCRCWWRLCPLWALSADGPPATFTPPRMRWQLLWLREVKAVFVWIVCMCAKEVGGGAFSKCATCDVFSTSLNPNLHLRKSNFLLAF